MQRIFVLALLLATADCAANGETALVAPVQAPPIYQRAQDTRLPIDQQVAGLRDAENGCSIETASAETTPPLPPLPGDASSAVHMQQELQGSPANTMVGDAGFDACMHSLGYDRIE